MTPGLDLIANILESDYAWGGFALGSLEPPLASLCEWRLKDGTLLLLYSGLSPRLVCPYGGPRGFAALLDELPDERVWANVPDELRAPFDRRYEPVKETRMRRMVFEGEMRATGNAVPLGPADREEIAALLATGEWVLFLPAALEQGHYFGVRDHGQLVAVAGTHVASVRHNTAALGTVYTHPAYRGRGFAEATSSHVLASVAKSGISRVVLNVEEVKAGARRVYERLGFRTASVYLDGECQRRV